MGRVDPEGRVDILNFLFPGETKGWCYRWCQPQIKDSISIHGEETVLTVPI